MMKLAGAALSLALILGGGWSAAMAQVAEPTAAPAAPTGRCGGLLCDAYYAMHPNAVPGATSLPCHDFLCAAFGGRTPDQPPPSVEQAAVTPAPVAPAKNTRKKVAASKAKVAAKPPEAAVQ